MSAGIDLIETVKDIVFSYAGGGQHLRMFPMMSLDERVFAVTIVDEGVQRYPAAIVVMVRLDGDRVIIEEDTTDRPLVEALVNAGISRQNIVLAYIQEQQTIQPAT
jgi:XisI protein